LGDFLRARFPVFWARFPELLQAFSRPRRRPASPLPIERGRSSSWASTTEKLPRARKILRNINREMFLEHYARTGSVCAAAKLTKIDVGNHYAWLKNTPGYPELFEKAHQKAIAVLEDEARRRSVEGVQEPVFYKGQVVGHITRFSDQLLMFLLKGANPAKYRENAKVEVTGTDGEPIRLEIAAAIAKVYGPKDKVIEVPSQPEKLSSPETTIPIPATASCATARQTGVGATGIPSDDQNRS
jgi:hypothetical protein